jgi:hypothetical protein
MTRQWHRDNDRESISVPQHVREIRRHRKSLELLIIVYCVCTCLAALALGVALGFMS